MLVLCNLLRKLMVSDKIFTGLLELIQLYINEAHIRDISHFHHLPKLYIGFKAQNRLLKEKFQ